MIEKLRQISRGLNAYRGRDASIRVVCFIALFLHGILANRKEFGHLRDVLLIVSKQFASCRVMMRFFEDFAAILNVYNCYTNTSSETALLKATRYVNLLSGFFYNIFEHLAWVADLKVSSSLDRDLWWNLTFGVWAIGLLSSLILNLKIVSTYKYQQKTKSKREEEDRKNQPKEIISLSDFKQAYVFAFRDLSDFIIAINCLPSGLLWSSTLGPISIGVLGIFASSSRVYYFVWKAD